MYRQRSLNQGRYFRSVTSTLSHSGVHSDETYCQEMFFIHGHEGRVSMRSVLNVSFIFVTRMCMCLFDTLSQPHGLPELVHLLVF